MKSEYCQLRHILFYSTESSRLARPSNQTDRSILVLLNEEIFIWLDELDELDKLTHAWIRFNYSLTQAQNTF